MYKAMIEKGFRKRRWGDVRCGGRLVHMNVGLDWDWLSPMADPRPPEHVGTPLWWKPNEFAHEKRSPRPDRPMLFFSER